MDTTLSPHGEPFESTVESNNNDVDHGARNGFRTLGYIGVIHCSLLSSIILWRFSVFLKSTRAYDWWTPLFNKKVVFHTLLLLSVTVDLPMYCTFLMNHEYVLSTYLSHKTSQMWIYLAYCIIVRDWIDVLYDIKEDTKQTYLAKHYLITFSSSTVILVTIVNVALGYTYGNNVAAYAHSTIYYIGLYYQLASIFCISTAMLQSGLKLAFRLQGATGATAAPTTPATSARDLVAPTREEKARVIVNADDDFDMEGEEKKVLENLAAGLSLQVPSLALSTMILQLCSLRKE